jgi:uncharacterized protein (DUF433 family)
MNDSIRIVIDPDICHGEPCIKGTRIPIYLILEMLEFGLSFDQIIEDLILTIIYDFQHQRVESDLHLFHIHTIYHQEKNKPLYKF